MVYLEQLRLIFLIILAYFSYRRLTPPTHSPALCLDSESEEADAGSLLESHSEGEGVDEERESGIDEEVKPQDGDCLPSENVDNADQIPLQVLSPSLIDSEPINSPAPLPDALCELDSNDTHSKLAKTKHIKKSWRRVKKESLTDTIVSPESHSEYQPSEVGEDGEAKENQMIDI